MAEQRGATKEQLAYRAALLGLCKSGCGNKATKRAGKSGEPGTDLCPSCWRAEFTDPEGDEDDDG